MQNLPPAHSGDLFCVYACLVMFLLGIAADLDPVGSKHLKFVNVKSGILCAGPYFTPLHVYLRHENVMKLNIFEKLILYRKCFLFSFYTRNIFLLLRYRMYLVPVLDTNVAEPHLF